MTRIRRIELLMVGLPLVRPFTTSSHTKTHLDHILIRVRDQDGAEAGVSVPVRPIPTTALKRARRRGTSCAISWSRAS